MPTATATPPNALREQILATEKKIELVELDQLNRKGLQLREETNPDAVARYAESYQAGEQLPPIVVFRDGDDLHLADGHHRVAAAKKAKLTELHAIVKKGDRRAAILYGASANGMHGLALTNADKRKIVGLLLADAEWKAWSNHEIARHARVSEAFVRGLRKELGAEQSEIKRKDGSTQKTRNAESKKPRQESLLDECGDEKAAVTAAWMRMQELPGCKHLPEAKCRILVALYYYNQHATPGLQDPDLCVMTRGVLAKHIGVPIDVHAGQLAAMGKIDRVEQDFQITVETYRAIDALLRPVVTAPPMVTEPPAKVVHVLPEAPAPTGPEEITAPTAEPEVPDGSRTLAVLGRPAGLRRMDKQREILSRRMMAGVLAWQGSDDDLFLLARIAGVPSAPTAWIDAARATARRDFLSALARECAERVRSGECMNALKWPQLAELCRLWGLDHQAIEIEAERAMPA